MQDVTVTGDELLARLVTDRFVELEGGVHEVTLNEDGTYNLSETFS